MVSNLGGLSDHTLTKHSSEYTTESGYTIESGILNPLMQTYFTTLLRKRNPSSWIAISSRSFKSVHAENDGTALQLSLQFDPTQKTIVGLASGNIKLDYVKANSEKNPDLTKYLKEDIAIEAVVTLSTNSSKTSSLSVGVSYCSKKGKSGGNLKENVIKEVMQLQCCKACLESSKDTIACSQCCKSSLCETCLNLEAGALTVSKEIIKWLILLLKRKYSSLST